MPIIMTLWLLVLISSFFLYLIRGTHVMVCVTMVTKLFLHSKSLGISLVIQSPPKFDGHLGQQRRGQCTLRGGSTSTNHMTLIHFKGSLREPSEGHQSQKSSKEALGLVKCPPTIACWNKNLLNISRHFLFSNKLLPDSDFYLMRTFVWRLRQT